MVDDGTRRDEFGPDGEPDAADEREPRPIHVRLNPPLARVTPWRLVMIAGILGGAVVVGFLIYAFISSDIGREGPSKGLEGVVLLVAGFVTVGILLYLGTLIHRSLDMGAPAEALGMPEGSIRALIAMSLILIFAIIGILVFNQGAAGTETVSTGVTQAQIDALRADGALVVSQTLQTPAPVPPGEPLYTVTMRSVMTREAHDFGLQLMTTVSTLVVAVAGFYFGSRSVSQASMSVQEQLRLARSFQGGPRRPEVIGARVDPAATADLEEPVADIEDEFGPPLEDEEGPGDEEIPTVAEREPEGGEERPITDREPEEPQEPEEPEEPVEPEGPGQPPRQP